MKGVQSLPGEYERLLVIDLQKDRREMLLVNGLSLVLFVILLWLGVLLHLFDAFFMEPMEIRWIWILALLIGILLYLVLHELTHGVCMNCFSAGKVQYGFTGIYAYAGSGAFFDRGAYSLIALAPVVLWGALFLICGCLLGGVWGSLLFFLQMINISGAAGDLYVTYRVWRMPAAVLIQDSGTAMTAYLPNK